MNRYVVDIIDEASGEKVGTSYEALRGQRMEVLMTNLGLEDTHRYKLQVKGYNNVRCGWHSRAVCLGLWLTVVTMHSRLG